MKVIGLDLSLASAGIARATVADGLDPQTFTCAVGRAGQAGATLAERWYRLDAQRERIIGEIGAARPDLVVVEAPSFGSQHGQQHDRSGLWWLVTDALFSTLIPVAEVAPSTLKVWATGRGTTRGDTKVTKTDVRQEIRRTYGHLFDIPSPAHGGNDIADAIALVTLGLARVGQPLTDVPLTHSRAIDSVSWPTLTRKD